VKFKKDFKKPPRLLSRKSLASKLSGEKIVGIAPLRLLSLRSIRRNAFRLAVKLARRLGQLARSAPLFWVTLTDARAPFQHRSTYGKLPPILIISQALRLFRRHYRKTSSGIRPLVASVLIELSSRNSRKPAHKPRPTAQTSGRCFPPHPRAQLPLIWSACGLGRRLSPRPLNSGAIHFLLL